MGIRESLLNTITSVGDSDFVRLVTSAGTSSKATVRNLFKGFESNLGAKSSLTTSDYLRVVGSDNEVYKQSVSSVKSALGVTALENGMSGISFTKFYAEAGGRTVNIPNNYRGVLYITDSNNTRCGEYIVFATGTGIVNTKAVSTASDITIDNSVSNKLTLSPASGSRWCLLINVSNVATV